MAAVVIALINNVYKGLAMEAEITFDLVMDEDMGFVEGCYRLPNEPWRVFIFSAFRKSETIKIEHDVVWKSGVKGVVVTPPYEMQLSKSTVMRVLSDALGVTAWSEMRGPDSMQLR